MGVREAVGLGSADYVERAGGFDIGFCEGYIDVAGGKGVIWLQFERWSFQSEIPERVDLVAWVGAFCVPVQETEI